MAFPFRQPPKPLPKNLNPAGTRCIQLTIPDDDEWEQAAYSAIYQELALAWQVWEKDTGKNATKMARRWRQILRTWKRCVPCSQPHGMEQTEMTIRTDCNCQTTVDCPGGGTQTLANKSDVPPSSAPNPNAPKPAPGGGVQQYCNHMEAASKLPVPALVNSGDVITLISAMGSGEDGLGAFWYCPDGSQDFGGCQEGTQFNRPADPLPTSPHMSLIIKIAGVFHPLSLTAPLIVPVGVTNEQAVIQINDDPLSDNFGGYDICYTVKNNQGSSWCHVDDLKTTTGGWIPFDDGGGLATWVAGQGWKSSTHIAGGGNNQQFIDLNRPIAASNIVSVTIDYHIPPNGGGGYDLNYHDTGGNHSIGLDGSPGDHLGVVLPIGSATVDQFQILLEANATDGSPEFFMKIKYNGTGSNPFGSTNC
jgi:hypothetical protein